ncbi:MAG: hypothetical protein J6C78_01240 [Muribaculaceae bacterium]|nr:hypothetical protein [Muribaculaceae bacterium]
MTRLRISVIVMLAMTLFRCAVANPIDYDSLPRNIKSGAQGNNHVQGIAVDTERGFVYYSFTSTLVKTDFNGNMLGSVTGMVGHLGCISLNPDDGRLYASLEYKNDEIGAGILKKANMAQMKNTTSFYIAIFDVERINKVGMDAEKDGVMTTVYVKDAVDDYNASVRNNGRMHEHRFGCSGIDGLTIAPAIGKAPSSKKFVYVAYGIYGDTTRTDNDHQVILSYDMAKLKRYEKTLSQSNPHKSGPEKPDHKYFVYTGNTSWGIQNLAYDKSSGNMFAAVYRGAKSQFPNYTYFVIDGNSKPARRHLSGFDDKFKAETLALVRDGLYDEASNTWGWNFAYGSTGLCPIGDGYFYISHNHRDKTTGQESSTVKLYRWTADVDAPFVLVD